MMTVTDSVASGPDAEGRRPRQSLAADAARTLATTTKSVPQMRSISPRWLSRMLPWVHVAAGTYRVNRRLTYAVGDGRVTCVNNGSEVRVTPEGLGDLAVLRGFEGHEILRALADRFEQHEFGAGDLLVEAGQRADRVVVIADGKANKIGRGKYGTPSVLDVLADGDCFGDLAWVEAQDTWGFSVEAVTACTALVLPHQTLEAMIDRDDALRAHIRQLRASRKRPQTRHGEAAIGLASGHHGEPELPATFVDYEISPREYELSLAQTVLRLHTRVADLFNCPMDQLEQQLRLTIEALRERREYELINNRDFGLLHNVAAKQRVHTRTGPPTPDGLDELLSRRRKSKFFLAHPRAIAAFGRECSRRGVYPATTRIDGTSVMAWRGVPVLPCDKIPITATRTSSILVLRTGEEEQGVVGLHQTGGPDEHEPGVNVRFMDINDKAVVSYLVSTYFSAAVLVPDALGVIEHVDIGR